MKTLAKQIKDIVDVNLPLISNLANASAILYTLEDINWAGFYLAWDNQLILGPFQGEIACIVIPCGQGVCGTAFQKKETVIVPNVNEFKGHIACSSKSKSEIVVPIIKDDKVVAVIDIDSPIYDRFHEEEKQLLEEVADILKDCFGRYVN